MTTLNQMYEKAQQFTDEVEADILNGDFTLAREGEYTYNIKVQDVCLSVWITGHPDQTRIHSIEQPSYIHTDQDFPKHRFTEPHLVRNALLAHSTNSMEDIAEEHC